MVAGVVGGVFGFCALMGIVCAGGLYFWHHYMLPKQEVVATPQAFIQPAADSQAVKALIGWRMAARRELQNDDDIFDSF